MNVLLVDDHSLFLRGLQNLLVTSGINVVGTAKDGIEAIEATRKLRPDVVLMDIQMPECDGVTATRLIKAEFPEIKIVMLTMIDEDKLLFEAFKNGASGFLLKNLDVEPFLELLGDVTRGETVFSPGLAERLMQEFTLDPNEKIDSTLIHDKKSKAQLTPRQEAVLCHIAKGLTYKEVALLLNISGHTVKYHMNEILERLHVETRAEAIAYAIQRNLIE